MFSKTENVESKKKGAGKKTIFKKSNFKTVNYYIKLTLVIFVFLGMGTGLSLAQKSKLVKKHKNTETVEWCHIWIDAAHLQDKPRILLIGDSIAVSYKGSVAKHLKGKAYCSTFSTSVSVADPTFHKQLEAMLCQYKYDVIHFNNGLHGFGYTLEEYQAGYEKALDYIKKRSPSSKIILVLSTPLKPGCSVKKKFPELVYERNQVVRSLAKKNGFKINDLHSISKDHPEYYADPYHFKKVAVELQAKQSAEAIKTFLGKAKKDSTDK